MFNSQADLNVFGPVYCYLINCYLCSAVKLGRRCFPNCSSVLDNFLDEESALTILRSGTPEDELRMRFYELREDLKKAFNKDKAVSKESSSSSPRYKVVNDNKPVEEERKHGNFFLQLNVIRSAHTWLVRRDGWGCHIAVLSSSGKARTRAARVPTSNPFFFAQFFSTRGICPVWAQKIMEGYLRKWTNIESQKILAYLS